mmetsp:Transcript_9023/g.14676  ORF Transcript_9023/g.14676 Transcript_9023/m.14676 type:complete len:109 (+) Transcript_9023:52-378(+)
MFGVGVRSLCRVSAVRGRAQLVRSDLIKTPKQFSSFQMRSANDDQLREAPGFDLRTLEFALGLIGEASKSEEIVASSVLKKRRMKMNKHKLKKRRRKDRFKTEKRKRN